MHLRIAEYNMEWMKYLFQDGLPINVALPADKKEKDWNKAQQATIKSQRLIEVIKHLDADLIAVVEGPNTYSSSPVTATKQLEAWLAVFGEDITRNYRILEGYASRGQQELCIIYDSNRLIVEHSPEAEEPFDQPFIVDTLDQDIEEIYRHYRPPLEATVKDKTNGKKLCKMIVVHSKSKGIFDRVDYARYERLSGLNRRKLYAECMHIRKRVDTWLKEGDNVIVTGDINDGMGSDFYEGRFGKSAVEILLGTVYQPALILLSSLGKPKLDRYGYTPSSSRFKDTITSNEFNVLIDHILVSQQILVDDSWVLNPFIEPHKSTLDDRIKASLKKASDHFPVVADVQVGP